MPKQLSPMLARLALITDTSDYAVRAVWVDSAWQPLAFFSRNLHDEPLSFAMVMAAKP